MAKRPEKPSKMIIERGRGELASGRGLVPAEGRLDAPYESYLTEIDPRGDSLTSDEFRFSLATASDMRFRQFLDALTAPRFKGYKLATIAKYCDISMPQFFNWWQSAQHSIALARAQNAMPALISDMTVDAASRMVSCGRCDGFGVVSDHSGEDSKLEGQAPAKIKPCPTCKGKGEVREIGNQHARDRLLEVGGMIKKDRGAAVQITQNFGGATMASAVDSLNKITFDVGGDVVDVEPD